jgi:hypothetical protein
MRRGASDKVLTFIGSNPVQARRSPFGRSLDREILNGRIKSDDSSAPQDSQRNGHVFGLTRELPLLGRELIRLARGNRIIETLGKLYRGFVINRTVHSNCDVGERSGERGYRVARVQYYALDRLMARDQGLYRLKWRIR